MATFAQLPSGRWRVPVRHRQLYASETFLHREDARPWATAAERRIDRGDAPIKHATSNPTNFADLIDPHIPYMCEVGQVPCPSKAFTLDATRQKPGKAKLKKPTREHLIWFGKGRTMKGAGAVIPSTDQVTSSWSWRSQQPTASTSRQSQSRRNSAIDGARRRTPPNTHSDGSPRAFRGRRCHAPERNLPYPPVRFICHATVDPGLVGDFHDAYPGLRINRLNGDARLHARCLIASCGDGTRSRLCDDASNHGHTDAETSVSIMGVSRDAPCSNQQDGDQAAHDVLHD